MDIITVAVCVLWFKEGASVYPEGVQEEEGAEEGSEDETTRGRARCGEEQMAVI